MNLQSRLGFHIHENKNNTPAIWFHAVSVGEVLSLQNLITNLKNKYPDWKIYLSTLTYTGFKIANKKIKADSIFYLPLDFSWVINRYFEKLKPKIFILTESEFWPNLLKTAKKNAKVILVNGRISNTSFKRYYLFRFLFRKILEKIDIFLVQSLQDKEKLEKIGISSKKIIVSGNLKADISLRKYSHLEINEIKKKMGINPNQKVIVAGSTLKNEEEEILNAFIEAQKIREDLVLIIAPRHPERFNEVVNLAKTLNLRISRKSELRKGETWDVLILDTLGELTSFYAIADLTFVGGSLIPKGGHNILEPAFYKKPVFFGQYMNNFKDISQKFLQNKSAQIVKSRKDLIEMMINAGSDKYNEMGKRARETLISLQGATEKTLKFIESFILNQLL